MMSSTITVYLKVTCLSLYVATSILCHIVLSCSLCTAQLNFMSQKTISVNDKDSYQTVVKGNKSEISNKHLKLLSILESIILTDISTSLKRRLTLLVFMIITTKIWSTIRMVTQMSSKVSRKWTRLESIEITILRRVKCKNTPQVRLGPMKCT